MTNPPLTPLHLNWKELELLIHGPKGFGKDLEGLFVDRLIVPERPRFPEGYLKGEWVIRLTGKKNDFCLLLSIRPRHPYLVPLPGKGPRASEKGTRSPFDLAVTKQLRGTRLTQVELLKRERTLILWFTSSDTAEPMGLVLTFIPAAPEALLVIRDHPNDWKILFRSRTAANLPARFSPPDGLRAPENPPVRTELVSDPSFFRIQLEKGLEAEAFELRVRLALREIKDLAKQARERISQSETAISEAHKEANWQAYGDQLKAHLGNPPPLQAEGKQTFREVFDYASDSLVRIPADPKLTAAEQVHRFYQLARRKNRRISEAQSRCATFRETLTRTENSEKSLPARLEDASKDWATLERIEASLPGAAGNQGAGANATGRPKSAGSWLGKFFRSKDGWTIWAGRSKDENLELTFKHARGNDLWMHVRGRPGAHIVIPVQPGKSVPLETLLDAAVLTLYYSGGEHWGKTEVDYTFKKHVKRIKDSSEASYTHNKTLLVEPEASRIKRLLGTNSGETS